MRHHIFAAAAAALVAAPLVALSAPTATAAVPVGVHVDFAGEAAGGKPNGYAVPGAPDVHFYDTVGAADLRVEDFGNQSNGLAIAAYPDDNSNIEIRLTKPTTSLSLAFGNDDPGWLDATDQARLTAYRGATQVGQNLVNVNANDLMDQRISIKNHLFNRVVFQYVDAAENPINLIEIVDDVEVGPLCTIVGTTNNDQLDGTSGNDVMCGDDGIDTLNGLGGDDLIIGGAGNDTLHGNLGNDRVNGGAGADRLYGDGGNDTLIGSKHKDRCIGGPGADVANSCEVRIGFP
jgi:Ca2+-binding RTX toxin-like protein